MLLECGADVDATNSAGVTPLLLAARGPVYRNNVHSPLNPATAGVRDAGGRWAGGDLKYLRVSGVIATESD